MLDCRKIKSLAAFYFDQDLSATDVRAIEEHVHACADCAAYYADIRALMEGFSVLRDQKFDAPQGFADRVMAALEKTEVMPLPAEKKPKATFKPKILSGIAAALLIFALWPNADDATVGSHAWNLAQIPERINSYLLQQGLVADNKLLDAIEAVKPVDGESHGAVVLPTDTAGNSGQELTSPDNASQMEKPVEQPLAVAVANTGNSGADPAPELAPVLMNSTQIVNSTLWKMQLNQFDADFAQVSGICSRNGASYQNMGDMMADGYQYAVIKVSVNKSNATNLANELSGLGTTLSKSVESKDLSPTYSEQLDQFISLQQKYEQSVDEQEKQNLKGQMAEIERQLQAWQQEANRETLVLWLAR